MFIWIRPGSVPQHVLASLKQILAGNSEQQFCYTLKRCCYILINNWRLSAQQEPIRALVRMFEDPSIQQQAISGSLRRLREWLRNFIAGPDYEHLKLTAQRYEDARLHWSYRYTPYLLMLQETDRATPIEQRQAARGLAKRWKDRFRRDLAIFTARSESSVVKREDLQNPTALGSSALTLIKSILARRNRYDYQNLANLFLAQTGNLCFGDFKQSLCEYLVFAIRNDLIAQMLRNELQSRLEHLYPERNQKPLNRALLIRTCNQLIDCLTLERNGRPSYLFNSLVGSYPLTLVILLLKLILVCRNSRAHLEARIAGIIHVHRDQREDECHWLVSFLETFQITFAIYAENIQYNLLKMEDGSATAPTPELSRFSSQAMQRIFSQTRWEGTEEEIRKLTAPRPWTPNSSGLLTSDFDDALVDELAWEPEG